MSFHSNVSKNVKASNWITGCGSRWALGTMLYEALIGNVSLLPWLDLFWCLKAHQATTSTDSVLG